MYVLGPVEVNQIKEHRNLSELKAVNLLNFIDTEEEYFVCVSDVLDKLKSITLNTN